MRYIWISVGLTLLLAGVAAVAAQEGQQELPKPQAEHTWLRQLVGEWDTEVEVPMPGKPPEKSQGTESGRMIGGFWAQLENRGEAMGQPFTGILTLGYDPGKDKYIGTWVDSMTSYLWMYEGTVDESGKILTLETEGPGHETPDQLVKYREVIEIKDKDHKIFTSSREKAGEWITGVQVHYRRKG